MADSTDAVELRLPRTRSLIAFVLVIVAILITLVVLSRTLDATYRSNGLEVSHPRGWRPTEADLTPNVSDPRQVLALSTTRLSSGDGDGRCAHISTAIADLASTDALVWIAERAEGDGFPARPSKLPPSTDFRNNDDSQECVPGRSFTSWWFSFADEGRAFHVLVIFGSDTSPRTQRDAWDILEGLEVEPEDSGNR